MFFPFCSTFQDDEDAIPSRRQDTTKEKITTEHHLDFLLSLPPQNIISSLPSTITTAVLHTRPISQQIH